MKEVEGVAKEKAETIKTGLKKMKEGTTELEELGEES